MEWLLYDGGQNEVKSQEKLTRLFREVGAFSAQITARSNLVIPRQKPTLVKRPEREGNQAIWQVTCYLQTFEQSRTRLRWSLRLLVKTGL